MKNTRDKLKKNSKMLSRQKNEKLDELKYQINDLTNKVRNLEIIKDRKIPPHEKLDRATVFYKHFMKLMASEKLEEKVVARIKEDKDLLEEIRDSMDKAGLFANKTFKAKRFTKEGDGPPQHLRLFVKYYSVFLNSYQGLPQEIQKQFRKVFNALFDGKSLGDLLGSGDEFEIKHALKSLDEGQVEVFLNKLKEEEVIDF